MEPASFVCDTTLAIFGGHGMTQSQLPHIWGVDWKPRTHLDFDSEVDVSNVKNELIRFIAERHDGHLRLVSWIFGLWR